VNSPRLAELWRYPVKSLAGERLATVHVDERGLEGDRLWALVDPDGGIASGKTTRRFRKVPGLLRHRSRLDGDRPVVTLADGRAARAGTPELDELVAEIASSSGWTLQRERGTPHQDAGSVHIVTTATLATLSDLTGEQVPVQRLRPNLLLEFNDDAPFPEDQWLGRKLHVGSVGLRVVARCERCVMVGHAQAGLEARPALLKTIGRANEAYAGVYAEVVEPGQLNEDDTATLGSP
jgi:uncharacterized protein